MAWRDLTDGTAETFVHSCVNKDFNSDFYVCFINWKLNYYLFSSSSKTPTSLPAKEDTRFSRGRELLGDDGNNPVSLRQFYLVYIFTVRVHTFPVSLVVCILLNIKIDFSVSAPIMDLDQGCDLECKIISRPSQIKEKHKPVCGLFLSVLFGSLCIWNLFQFFFFSWLDILRQVLHDRLNSWPPTISRT